MATTAKKKTTRKPRKSAGRRRSRRTPEVSSAIQPTGMINGETMIDENEVAAEGEVTAAPTEPKVQKARKLPKLKGRRPGKVADFKPLRADNTNRAQVIRMAHDHKTVGEIVDATGMDRHKVLLNLYCIARDRGVGYGEDPEGRLFVTFPGNKTIDDLILQKGAQANGETEPDGGGDNNGSATDDSWDQAAPADAVGGEAASASD